MCTNCLFPKVQKQLLKPKKSLLRIAKNANPDEEIHELQSIQAHNPKEIVSVGCESPEFDLHGILADLSMRKDRDRRVEKEASPGKGNFSLFNYGCYKLYFIYKTYCIYIIF